MAGFEQNAQFTDESSHVSFLLDQEEYTLQFDEHTTIEKIEVSFLLFVFIIDSHITCQEVKKLESCHE